MTYPVHLLMCCPCEVHGLVAHALCFLSDIYSLAHTLINVHIVAHALCFLSDIYSLAHTLIHVHVIGHRLKIRLAVCLGTLYL